MPRRRTGPRTRIRPARDTDLDALLALEGRVFATDRLSRRALRRLLAAGTAAVLAAESAGALAGYAMVLFRAGSAVARLYSILVDPRVAGRGIGAALLAAAEAAATARGAALMRLEVATRNRRAIRLYERAGYRAFGRYEDYYEDGAPALRYQKPLAPPRSRRRRLVP